MDEVHHAILRGDLPTVKRLVAQDPDCLDLSDWDARSPLILSVLSGALPLVQFFVEEARAEVDEAVPPDGCSALFYACRDARVAIASYLLAKGADPCQHNRYNTTLPMILASNAPSPPQSHDNEEEEEEKEDGDEGGEGEGGGYGTTEASPHAQLMRLLLRAVDGGPEARAVLVDLVDARNRNGKTALVMAIERRRPDLAAALLGAGADPFLMPPAPEYLLPLPLPPGQGTSVDRALAALLEDARQAPERVALLKRARRLSDAAHAVGKVLTTTTAAASAVAATSAAAEAAASSTSTAQQVDDPLPATALLPKLLAAAPQELRPRLERAAAGVVGDTPGAEFAQTVLAALPRVEVVGVEEEEGEGREVGARRLRDTVAFVAVDGGLKDELFVELMAMMSHGWFARVWEGEGV